jgi:NitT/TauT family transport system substrate-binding protein
MKKARTCLAAMAVLAAAIGTVSAAHAAAPQLEKTHLEIGSASLDLTYLPVVIAQRKGYFKDEGLDVQIAAFSGGSKALEALMGGSVDLVSGAYSHTIELAAKGQQLVEVVEQIRCPGFAIMVSKKHMANYHGIKDLKGMKIGVSAPGSSTQEVLDYILAKNGVKPTDVSVIGVGTSAGAVAAMRAGEIDALIMSDPILTILQEDGDTDVVDMRTPANSDAVFGGPYPEASVYATRAFVEKNPHTVQAVVNAVVRAERWMAAATPEQIADSLPSSYWVANKPLYLKAMGNMRSCYSPDGLLTHEAAQTVDNVLASYDSTVRNAKIDLDKTYDNSFVNRVPAATH